MKKSILFFAFLICIFSKESINAQGNNSVSLTPVSPGGYFDRVFDKDGNEYSLSNLEVKLNYSNNNTFVSSTTTCSAGFFNVYFANGSGMESTTIQAHNDRRALVCHILENVSGLLGGWATWPSSVHVNMLVDNITNYGVATPSTSGVLGLASSFYAIPSNPSSNNSGIAENMLQKTIKSKQDAWTNIVSPVISTGGSGFYHGVMAFNFGNPSFNWFTNYSGSLAASNQLDLYTVILHEITHALGFASLINSNGFSKFGVTNNYFSSYDKYLYDKNYNPLLTATGCSPQYGLTFSSSTLNLAPSCTGSTPTNSTSCTLACLYNSSNLAWMPLYTPGCFEGPSSLSHFEDMCFPTTNAANNDLYFTMSNANGNGTNKRFLKPEERKVLCDLGYTVSTSYTSNAVGASTVYSGGACTPANIWGQNDGFVNSAYSYTSLGGVINFSISGANGVLSNDASSAVTASCVQSVYNNGTVSTNYITGVISFTPANFYVGPILLRYIPVDVSGNQGNITYIYGFVFPGNCVPASPCDMVQNGTFETNVGCGGVLATNGNSVGVSCWIPYTLSPDLFVSGCNTSSMSANLGLSTYSSSFNGSPLPFTSINPATNSAVIGLGAVSGLTDLSLTESYANFLGSPLINNQVYTLNFWAYQFVGAKTDPFAQTTNTQAINTNSVPMVISFASSNSYQLVASNMFPTSVVTVIKSVTLASTFNVWRNYNVTFTYTPAFNGTWLYLGPDSQLGYGVLNNMFPGGGMANANQIFYVLLDNISIKPIAQSVQFNLPVTSMCASQGYTDLAQYVSIPNGTFSGTGVTTTTTTPMQYKFNSPASLTNGLYTITYTYQDQLGCVQTAVQQVSLGTTNSAVNLSYVTSTTCVNGATLSVVSPTSGLSYTWMPGNSVANSIAVNPTVSTTYTAQAFVNGSCFYTGTLQISPTIPNFSIGASTASICPGSNGILSAIGSYSTILWSPGNYTYSPVTITPTGNVIYTATATSSLGCITTKTIAITVPFLPVSITTNSTNICTGGSVTLTAVGAGTFCGSCVTWYPPVISSNSLVVSPSVTTVYSAQIVNPLGCIATPTQQINVSTFTIVPSFANSCAGSLGTLTAAGGFTSVVWQPGGYTVNPLSVTVTPNLTYTATANFSNGCVATQTFAFGIVDISPPNFQITTNFPVTCAGNSETLSISSPYLTSIVGTTWIPSGTISPTLVITPTASATYSAYVANTSGCVFLAIGSVNVSTACCTGTYSALANVGVVTQTITGSKVVNGNIVIPAGGNLTLSGEFLFAPNVKITVNPGASIHLKDAHLYSCSNTMWQGIEILDGASLTSLRYNKDNLIEDAITAINAMNQATTSLSAVLTISNTTFNKNYVDININNYMRTSTNYPFVIKSCVFTCRNLPFNASTWPQTGTVSAAASNSADLRYIVPGSLSGLSGPYLTQGFSTTPLKNPHSSQGSQTAIQLTNVGITNFSSPYCITIGDGTVTANTNVFDAHNKFIDATNSNVKSYNNIYQNTQVVSGAPGIAIQSRNTYTNSAILNSELNLLAPSNPAVNINRFYNCHTGVNAINLAWLTAQYAEFKSTQSTTVAASTSNPGQFGINITTNRVYSYLISNCNFINLTTGVYGANTSGAINPFGSPAVNGQVWGSFIINYNTFSPSTSTVTGTNFMRDGVIIEALISARGMAGSALAANVVTVSPLNGLRIQNNNFNLVYRGVRVSNFTNSLIGKFTANNTIKLKQDHISSNTQWGVNHSNNYASVVNTNAIAGFTNSLTFTVSGVYSSMNANSSAQCNSLTVLPIDMQFTGFNSTVWRRNNMSASSRGIQLSSNGIMGQQGTFSSPNDNVWTGSWTGTNYNTFSSGSLPNLSLLYKRTLTLYNPTNNLGAPFTYSPGVSLFNANNSAPYGACAPSVKPNRGGDFIKINLAKAIASGTITYPGFFSTETNEINQILLYGELDEDSILLSSDAALQSFFSTNQSGNLGALATINELLCAGDLTSASTALNNFSENSTMQSNYKLYYQLYLVYLDPALDLSAADLTNLQNLAAKCPFIDGPVVYNARSLYTTVTGLIGDYNDEACDENENNLMFNQEELERTSAKRILAKSGAENYQMYPNPASDKLYILGKSENEEITIEIKDLANKLLFRKVTQLSQYNTELKLDLINGVYFVTLINSNDERTTKKLVISK